MSRMVTIKSEQGICRLTFEKIGVDTMSINVYFEGFFSFESKVVSEIDKFVDLIENREPIIIENIHFDFMESHTVNNYTYADSYIISAGKYNLGRFTIGNLNTVHLMKD